MLAAALPTRHLGFSEFRLSSSEHVHSETNELDDQHHRNSSQERHKEQERKQKQTQRTKQKKPTTQTKNKATSNVASRLLYVCGALLIGPVLEVCRSIFCALLSSSPAGRLELIGRAPAGLGETDYAGCCPARSAIAQGRNCWPIYQ